APRAALVEAALHAHAGLAAGPRDAPRSRARPRWPQDVASSRGEAAAAGVDAPPDCYQMAASTGRASSGPGWAPIRSVAPGCWRPAQFAGPLDAARAADRPVAAWPRRGGPPWLRAGAPPGRSRRRSSRRRAPHAAARARAPNGARPRSEEHTSELQSRGHLVCRLLLEKKKKQSMSLYHI